MLLDRWANVGLTIMHNDRGMGKEYLIFNDKDVNLWIFSPDLYKAKKSHQAKNGCCKQKFSEINARYLDSKAVLIYGAVISCNPGLCGSWWASLGTFYHCGFLHLSYKFSRNLFWNRIVYQPYIIESNVYNMHMPSHPTNELTTELFHICWRVSYTEQPTRNLPWDYLTLHSCSVSLYGKCFFNTVASCHKTVSQALSH